MNKCIVLSAPSGSGKTTLAKALMQHSELKLAFSVSATSRPPRGQEQHGKAYFFLSPEAFQQQIQADAFVEYEEVYPGMFYGTLHSEIERIWAHGKHVVFDIDVAGGINIKNKYPEQTCSIFIKPPNIETLSQRLRMRNTDSLKDIEVRLQKATQELALADQFDYIITNDNLEQAQSELYRIVADFINS
jgi:guanylate kinase